MSTVRILRREKHAIPPHALPAVLAVRILVDGIHADENSNLIVHLSPGKEWSNLKNATMCQPKILDFRSNVEQYVLCPAGVSVALRVRF